MRLDPFYLIVGDAALLARLVPLGVRLVQLRLKDQSEAEARRQITLARDICHHHGAQLVVNDFWQLAIDLGCDAVHLGQEDMERADFAALRRHGVAFGLSTHDEAELERALALNPAYVALGPIWPTLLKPMKWRAQGLGRVTAWKARAGAVPLVAIGGITPDRLPGLFAAGADCAAVVTDIAQSPSPEARCREWLAATREHA
jgi:thiamine-phosphate pyrophosphorylase